MRVFVAGATGAIGRPLVRQLLRAGHEVIGSTRTPEKARWLEAVGAQPCLLDLNDGPATERALLRARPDVVMDQTTDLPRQFRATRRHVARFYDRFVTLRRTGGRYLLDAAAAAGARRYILQSVAFIYAPGGPVPKTEEAPLFLVRAPAPWGRVVPVLADLEQQVLGESRLQGLVLRFGYFYGPLTHFAPGGAIHDDVRRRRFPLVGQGGGIFPFIHVADAAAASVRAVEHGPPGIYNVVDDDPQPVRVWLPEYARQIGARPPLRVPPSLARVVSGPLPVYWSTGLPTVANTKAKAELGWQPRWASWRDGFGVALNDDQLPVAAVASP